MIFYRIKKFIFILSKINRLAKTLQKKIIFIQKNLVSIEKGSNFANAIGKQLQNWSGSSVG